MRNDQLKETQLLLAQILHDAIGSFTALSTGIDLLKSNDDEIWDLTIKSKEELSLQLILMRFIFSYGEGSVQEANELLQTYARKQKIKFQGNITQNSKLMLGLGFWLIKQNYARTSVRLSMEDQCLTLASEQIRDLREETLVLQNMKRSQSPSESYASYLAQLAQVYKKRIVLQRTPKTLVLTLFSVNS